MLPPLSPAVVAHIRRTKHRTYWILLARDPALWLPVLEREAAKPWPPAPGPVAAAPAGRPAPDPSRFLIQLGAARDCPYGAPWPAGCGCNASRHCWRLGTWASLSDCLRCVQGQLPGPEDVPHARPPA